MLAKKKESPQVEEATSGEGTGKPEAEDPRVAEARTAHEEAVTTTTEIREALVEAEAAEVEAKAALDALTLPPPPPPITGPRVKLEETGEIVAVQEGEQRERRLLLKGANYEHVSDVEDQGEVVWVYRRM